MDGAGTSNTICTTPRLRLRTALPSDATFYHALLNDAEFIAHIGDRGIRTLDEAHRALQDGPIAMQRERGHSLYVVEAQGDETPGVATPLGMCGLIRRETLPEVDLGYAFLPIGRGRGYALEAARAVLGHAPSLGFSRVLAITSPDNTASNSLLLRLGMRYERFVQLTPADPGTNLYSIELGPAL